MNNQFRHTDTKKPDGFYIQWHMVLEADDTAGRPDERQDGFWPSADPNAAGYVSGTSKRRLEQRKAEDRMKAWEAGDWSYVGVIAEARCLVVSHGVGTFYEFRSPGCWGIESDAGDYLKTVFEEEKAELLAHIALMRDPVQEN